MKKALDFITASDPIHDPIHVSGKSSGRLVSIHSARSVERRSSIRFDILADAHKSTRANSFGEIDEKFLRPEIEFAWIRQEYPHLVCSLVDIDRCKAFC